MTTQCLSKNIAVIKILSPPPQKKRLKIILNVAMLQVKFSWQKYRQT